MHRNHSRYKDRTSSTSQLTPVEATRFLVSLYRVWFVVSFLDSCTPPYRRRHLQWSVPAVPNADFTDEWDIQLSVQTSSLLQPFISSSEGMQSIYDIAYFLTEVIRWVACSRQRRCEYLHYVGRRSQNDSLNCIVCRPNEDHKRCRS